MRLAETKVIHFLPGLDGKDNQSVSSFRMKILVFSDGAPSIRDDPFRAVMEASQTHRASMPPSGRVTGGLDIADRTDARTKTTADAFRAGPKWAIIH